MMRPETTPLNDDQHAGTNPLHLAAELTTAWLRNPATRAKADDVPAFLRTMHETMVELHASERPPELE